MSERARNVVDHYRYWETDEIRADLDARRHDFSVLVVNLARDFNVGTVIRNCNAFLGRRVYVLGEKRYDRRGSLGTYIYEHVVHVRSLDELPEGPLVAVDNVPGAAPLDSFEWPRGHFVMAFGHEQHGLTEEVLAAATHTVYIRQHGSVRSLNVATAAGIAMYDYCCKLGRG